MSLLSRSQEPSIYGAIEAGKKSDCSSSVVQRRPVDSEQTVGSLFGEYLRTNM
jgi:hypothetical protein